MSDLRVEQMIRDLYPPLDGPTGRFQASPPWDPKKHRPPRAMSAAELIAILDISIEDSETLAEAHDERIAIQHEHVADDLPTTERAIAALQRPEKLPQSEVVSTSEGSTAEHDVARAWLRQYDPQARRTFTRRAS